MAGGSLRKKPNKRSNLKPQPSMPTPSSSSPPNYRKISVFISIVLIVCVTVLLRMSTDMWSVFGFNTHSNHLYSIEVVNEFPHDPKAFTQGLLYGGNDTLFESTGLNGQFEKFTHQMQDGWGLATDGKVLFGTDGTSTFYQIDPQTLKVIGKQTVKYKGNEVHNLNELEYVNGEVWANVWQTDCIARISHKDGVVLGWILLQNLRKGLLAAGKRDIDVLNGIAWDRDKKRLFVTGKLWPKLYEIKLHPLRKPFRGVIEQICMPLPVHFTKP